MHVRFAKRERIGVRLVFQVCQRVVDKPVSTFVGADGIDDVQQGCVRLKTPVIFCYLGSGMVGPLWEAASFDIFDTFLLFRMSVGVIINSDAGHTNRIREHRFLLKMSHELSDPDKQRDSGRTRWVCLHGDRYLEK